MCVPLLNLHCCMQYSWPALFICDTVTSQHLHTSGQGAIAHEAALGGGHVTTWIAVRGHLVDEQITALMHNLSSSSAHMHVEHDMLVKDHSIQQQVPTCSSATIELLMQKAKRQLCCTADSLSRMRVPMHTPNVTLCHA